MYSSNWAALGTFLAGLSCFGIILYIVYVVGLWKLFNKLGLEGWKSIIPFYNIYVLAEKTWDAKFIIYLWVAVILYNIVNKIAETGGFIGVLLTLISIILWVVIVVIRARFCYYNAKAFGYDLAYAVGWFFLPFVFTCIIGFGDAKYVGNYFKESGAQY